MTVKPIWITSSGSLGSFEQSQPITPIVLEVANANEVKIISKTLPNGLKLDSITKTITGVPLDSGITKTYDFVVRASIVDVDGKIYIQDRTFNITIISNAQPVLLTPPGAISIGLNKENFVLNKSIVNFQFDAVASSVPPGQKLKFYLEENKGELPPGLKLSEDGFLYGTIDDDLELDFKVVQGTYDRDFYDINPYDYGTPIEPARGTTTVANGKIQSVSVTYGGNGYLLDPKIIVGGSVDFSSIVITNGGNGYTVAPTVVFSNSLTIGGITATGYAEISNGSVTNIVITNPGTGYEIAPTIIFKDQNTGTGASATCDLQLGLDGALIARVTNGTVVDIDIENPGSGYQTAPAISFGAPTAGSRIISKTYKFSLTVANGELTDTKIYTIFVKSENSLRVDTTFIFSDTVDFDTSRTYIQPPIWITPNTLPIVKGNNNYIYDLEIFDPTPNVGKLYFGLLDFNFDGTPSEFGPRNNERNQITYNIVHVDLESPVVLRLSQRHTFKDGDRVRISNVGGTTELNDDVYYVKIIDEIQIALYSDVVLVNPIVGTFFTAYTSGGKVNPEENYLKLDPVGGEINGFIPYQPSVTKIYTFTVQIQRILDDVEVANSFKQFQLTVEGNIQGDINFITPTLVGTLKPNEQSLLKIEAESTLPSASVVYDLIPGYGKTSGVNYIELNLTEYRGNILIENYGINPVVILEKGQSYKINVDLDNFTLGFKNVDGTYYNSGIRHSTGVVGQAAQEKSSGYYIFIPPFNETDKIELVYTNTKKDGLFLALKKYNIDTKEWDRQIINSYFTEYDAYTNLTKQINANQDAFAIILDYTKIQFGIKKYNAATLTWDLINIPVVKPTNPTSNSYWLDIATSSFGVLEFRYFGLQGRWVPVIMPVVTAMPNNSEGVNGNYRILNDVGTYKVLRKINGVWKIVQRLPIETKTAFDPNVFFKPAIAVAPVTNLQYDVWFKYNTLYDGLDQKITVNLKSLDNLPTDVSIGLGGDIIGKITPTTGNTFKGYYSGNVLYVANDVVTFNNSLYICVNQYRSTGNWYQELTNWNSFAYTKRVATTIDVNSYGVAKFSIHGINDDGTSIDQLLRFRIRAKDTQNVSSLEKDFTISYESSTVTSLTNIYLQPFLGKESRDRYFNFITDTTIFLSDSLYRSEDPNFGIQRVPKMLLLGGIENTRSNNYVSAVQRNYYDRPLYFGDIKVAIAKNEDKLEYEVIYVEINDPYEINNVSVSDKIKLAFDYDPLTVDYSKIRVDDSTIVATDTGLDTIYPSSITLMQDALKKVMLETSDSVLVTPNYEDWGGIIGASSDLDDWGLVAERVSLVDDFLLARNKIGFDIKYRPLWMNTSQDGTGNPVGFTKAIPICYVKPGESAKILRLIERSKFDFKLLNFKIDRIVIQNPLGETGDKYIKFINREII